MVSGPGTNVHLCLPGCGPAPLLAGQIEVEARPDRWRGVGGRSMTGTGPTPSPPPTAASCCMSEVI